MSDADHPRREPADATLWGFAVELYTAPGVAEACLALQDRHGCDVNVLLFATWMGAVHHRALTPAEMAEAAATVQDWHAEIVRPLRSVRRRLKSGPAPAPNGTTESLRARLKSVELEAERVELAILEALAAQWQAIDGESDGASLENLKAAVQYFSAGEASVEALELIGAMAKGLQMRVAMAATE
jgi:uncharacterized protein (TIGR02444 family)